MKQNIKTSLCGLLLAASLTGVGMRASAQEVRYQGEVNAGYAVGVGTFATDRVVVETIHGVRIGNHFFVGAGIGVHAYTEADGSFIPIFADAKYYFLRSKVQPYVGCDLGYGMGTGDFASAGGVLVAPGIGVRIATGRRQAFLLSVTFQSQSVSESGVSVSFNALGFRLGYSF